MFGLNRLFASIGRLTAALTTTSELFEAANEQLRERLVIRDEPLTIVHHAQEEAELVTTNGRAKRKEVAR